MAIDFFGFSLGKKAEEKKEEKKKPPSFVEPNSYDGTYTMDGVQGGFFGSYVDFLGIIKSENDLISKYRGMSLYPEVDQAIEDITNESIVYGHNGRAVDINLDNTNLSDKIKSKVAKEFENVLTLINFSNKGSDIFRRWYVDSKLYYHMIFHEGNDPETIKRGLKELRPIDPVKIRKIRKVQKGNLRSVVDGGQDNIPVVKKVEEFFLFTDTTQNTITPTPTSGMKISVDAICYVPSGVVDATSKRVIGYLHKAIRPMNMLRQIEDAVVIYRISRAPERRIFYIDVGNLPKQKAEQYLRDIMNRYRNKITYDAATGEIKDDRRHMSMLEDYWIPRREGGKGTEITTLDGGQNLGEMEDVMYLQKKLYRALNVPISRLESESGFNLGRSTEITRDEVKFAKFIEKLRSRFNYLFLNILKIQLIAKGIILESEWNVLEQQIMFKYQKDSYFSELKELEIMKDKMEILRDMQEYVGVYFSKEYIKKEVLHQTDEDILKIESQIQKESASEPQEEGEF
jgi:hypothetical protein